MITKIIAFVSVSLLVALYTWFLNINEYKMIVDNTTLKVNDIITSKEMLSLTELIKNKFWWDYDSLSQVVEEEWKKAVLTTIESYTKFEWKASEAILDEMLKWE